MKTLSTAIFFGLACWAAPLLQADDHPQRIGLSHRYPLTYADWENAFLAGNGYMGIMVFGNPLEETVIYNDRGFNLPKTQDRSFDQVSAADLETIKADCAKGDYNAADQLAASAPHYKGGGDGSRHPGYAMFISIPPDGAVDHYSRICNFRTGEIVVKWSDDRGDWERKSFVSRQDNVIVQSLTAPTKGTLTCSIRLDIDPGMGLPKSMTFTTNSTAESLNIRARYRPKADIGYEGVTRVVVAGGTHIIDGNVLKISGANSVLLLTRTKKYNDHCEDQWNQEGLQKQLAEIPADYDKLLKGQLATHEAIYDRVKLDLNASAPERAKSNEDLLAEQKASPAPVLALWERIFDSGRYFYLSSSSEETPPDLLGIWTGNSNAGWGGFYHMDANVNLQISQGNIGDMPEAMEGYFKINESWRKDFETNAGKLLGCRGMLAAGNSPGTGAGLMASINVYYPYQYATGEEDWLLYPFWEHYLVTGDTAFLRDRLYPLLKEMGAFYEDFLTRTDANGNYLFAGSVSPENQPSNLHLSLVNNSNFDISGAKFVLTALIQTCNTLGLDQGPGGGVEKWTALLHKIPPYLINQDGAMKEWAWPGLDESYGHRHSSHFLNAWPYREITPESDPVMYKAALVALAKKDENNITPGHGLVHGALVAAVLKNDQSVRVKLLKLTRNGYFFDSLFTSHAPDLHTYCGDVCHTVPAIMMEMLVSSSPGVVELLPALPKGLEHGSISGVKGRCRVTVASLDWNMDDHSVNCVLKSDIDQNLTLIERSGMSDIHSEAAIATSPLGAMARVVTLKAGVSTHVSIKLGDLRPRIPNLAQGQPVTVSSTDDPSRPGSNAVDEDTSSRWSSKAEDNQWIYVDLGASKSIVDIKLDWESAAGKDYVIEVSDDAQTWTAVKSVPNNSATGWLDYPQLQARGRYVRINGKTRLTKYGFSLWELQVFGRD
jgi:alpha-L-fucosidase 2